MPGVRVTSVRRTVFVAVALVTAQALLGGVIGFVTFGGDRNSPAPPAAAEPRLAGPPVVPPASLPTPAERVSIAASRAVRTERPTSPQPPPATERSPATRTSSPAPAVSKGLPPLPPMPTISVPDPDLVAPPQDDAPVPVAGEFCDEAGAEGRTADDKAVRCLRGRDGRLRWRLV
jgi:hypothetical protein